MKTWIKPFLCLLSLAASSLLAQGQAVDMQKRAEELKNERWGMFVCWSLSTFSGKEWTPGVKDVSFFKATDVDTDQWALTAKEAGMGYILFLAKHHDGFCLWDTKTTDRKVTKAPLGRDVLAELRKSCDKYGIKLALYFSEGDWTWPGAKDGAANGSGQDAAKERQQLTELLSNYGPIEYMWVDHAAGTGGLSHAEFIAHCKALQPGCFIGFNHGDQTGVRIRLGEMGKPGPLTDNSGAGYNKGVPSKDYLLAEFTYPIQPKRSKGAMWFYSHPDNDNACLPAKKLYDDYLGAVKFGNIFSIDVGPDYNGKLREIDVKTLREVGEMIKAGPSSAAAENPASGMVINASTPWVIADGQPEAVQRALDDVATDWYKVFGRRPVVVRELPATYKGPALYMGATGSWRDDMVRKKPAGKESFIVCVQKDSAGRLVLVATGADIRGSIYAAYALSEEILGVDPWYYWVDKEPAARSKIEIPAGFDRQFGSPTFKYRGWFINDEDLLARYSPDPLRENVFSLEALDRICETLLRLRGNMIVPATFAFPDERCNELAARRGLVLNMHHILVLGLNTYQWPKNVPFSYSKHPEIMEKYWQTCIDAYKNYEVVWSVGYRGKGDQPFWTDEKDLTDHVKRGEVITRAIAKQVELVHKVNPDADIIANMWSEGAEMYHEGLIKLPDCVTLVWPDKGNGMICDNGKVKSGQGIYYHTAMLNGRCNQMTEMVNPGRIYNQVGRFVKAGATEFFLVNVSDIRPVPLSTDCAMKFAWDAKPYLGKTDKQNMADFYEDWSRRQFGAEAAGKVSEVYRDYFDCPYMNDENLKGENWVQRCLRQLNDKVSTHVATGKPIEADARKMCSENLKFSSNSLPYMEKLLTKAEKVLALVPADRRDFYQGHVLTQIQIHVLSLAALKAYCQSLDAYDSGEKAKAVTYAETCLQVFDKIYPELHKAEYGKWTAWYEGECFLGLERTRGRIENMLAVLKGDPEPVKSFNWDDYEYEELYHYQKKSPENFPLLYPRK